jgi:hypothetical protein
MTAQALNDQISALISANLDAMDELTKANYMARRRSILMATRDLWDAAAVDAHLDATVGNMVYVSKSEAMKYGRIEKLNDLLTEEAKKASIIDISNLEKNGIKIYETGYDGMAWVYAQGYGLPITGGARVKLVAAALYSNFYGASFDETIKKNLSRWPVDTMGGVQRALNQGWSYGKIAAQIKDETNKQYWKALRVARTEGGRIQSQAYLDSLALLDEVGADYSTMWVHQIRGASKSYEPREDHIDMDGRESDKNGVFKMPSGFSGPAPRLIGNPGDDCNCGCECVTLIGGEKPTARRVRGEGIVSFETYRERQARGGTIPILDVRNARRGIK